MENDSTIDCGEADVIDNADISYGTDASQQSIASYECHPGYELEGGHTRTCGQNSVWLGLLPFCSGKHTLLAMGISILVFVNIKIK